MGHTGHTAGAGDRHNTEDGRSETAAESDEVPYSFHFCPASNHPAAAADSLNQPIAPQRPSSSWHQRCHTSSPFSQPSTAAVDRRCLALESSGATVPRAPRSSQHPPTPDAPFRAQNAAALLASSL